MIINFLMQRQENRLAYFSILPCVSCHQLAKMHFSFISREARPALLFTQIFIPGLEAAKRSCQTVLSAFPDLTPN